MKHIYLAAMIVLVSFSAAFGGREISDLNENWKFIKSDVPAASQTAFDDSSWEGVTLPHTWNASDATGGTHNYYRGPGWYRRHFTFDATRRDARARDAKELYLWFGAAGTSAEVFVNGSSIGVHKGGFAAFCFDVTSAIKPGDNVIAVRVTNIFDAQISPISGDFNICGGLYRGAKLLSLEKLSISPIDSASCGVYVKQSKITSDSAELEITTKILNASAKPQAAKIISTILDADG